jgi:hypothetical protein
MYSFGLHGISPSDTMIPYVSLFMQGYIAGIPQYATYLIHRLYNPQMAVVHLRALAAYLISETATQDPKVGGPIRIAEITPEKGYQELDESIVNEIIKKNEEQNLKLRKFFSEG